MIVRSIDAIIRMLDADYIENGDIDAEIMGVSIDSRKIVKGNLFIPIKGERFNGHQFIEQAIENGAVAALWNRDEPNPPEDIVVILVEDTLSALQKLAALYRSQLHLKIVGITGSNGKTSTKDILAAMLSSRYVTQKTLGNYNNEIGVPLTLLSLSEHCEAAVIEMGMENFHELDLLTKLVKPDVVIITNVGTAHLENLGSIENIAKAKLEIVHGLDPNGLFIYNGDQLVLTNAVKMEEVKGSIRIKTFGEQKKNDVYLKSLEQTADGLTFQINDDAHSYEMNMLGRHQAINALAAIMAAKELSLTSDDIQRGLQHIEKTGMRNELVQLGSCMLLNDSYKSNPQSAMAALDTLESIESPYKIAVLADMLDLGEETNMIHYNLGKALADYHLDEILTYGELGRYITQGANAAIKNAYIRHFVDKRELLEYLLPYVKKKCMILVKGSRGMHMDEIVDGLKESLKHEKN